ncbi:hypothetical protein JQC92_07185 [Shewanella sp. 202IG2-18]|uniref:hypothetical protein n=1 Tax=Parashewanella hymeniacidonis TaxID=2807618 RepID=UPI00195FECFC|nr:hypothetical protein [Parashewanella hymeniacidonis]MBM7071825.1 hypothetical protein [Parashewanella hymeniacidonis]
MAGLTFNTNEAINFQLGITKGNVEKLVSFADEAIARKSEWQDVTFEMPNGKVKKFQVKFDVVDGKKTVSTRRNSKLATLSRTSFINKFFGRFRRSDTKAFDKAAGDVIKRYTLTRHSITNNPSQKAAHEHFLGKTELQAVKPFINENGYTSVMAPSNVLKELAESQPSDEHIALVFDLDSTLYTEGDYIFDSTQNVKSLDPELPEMLRTLKEKHKNLRIFINTQTPIDAEDLMSEKLNKCGYNPALFDFKLMRGDTELKYNGQRAHTKCERLLSAFEELKKQGWEPAKVKFFDDNDGELRCMKSDLESTKIPLDCYQVHAAKHFSDYGKLISRSAQETVKRGHSETQVNCQDLINKAEAKTQHYYYMLRG